MRAVSIVPVQPGTRIFIGGCASIVLAQVVTAVGIMRTMHSIAGHVVPPSAAEAYAAGYAVGAVQGERRQDERRTGMRGRSADRARRRRDEGGA
jgi:hypothetical protein